MRRCFLWMALCLGASTCIAAEPPSDPQLLVDVLPLFKTRCVKCHGPAKSEAHLNLSTPGTVARGGENGSAIARGDPEKSLLWQRVTADEMPPDEPLPTDEKNLLRRWITAGAKGLPETISDHPSGDHWAFAPLSNVALPQLPPTGAARNAVDNFVLDTLSKRGLTMNPEADPSALIRRVSFDLTGLPPTPAEIAAFLSDGSPDAYERMVDRYLASPHYGQRWGKYWLDAAGYADSNGYFNADSDRPLAYRYRDYVVRSFNADKPFDRFVVEQLAGDELAGFKPGTEATPEIISLLEATHFLRNGQDGTGESDGNPQELKNDRYAALEGCMQIVASSFLGLTMQCAKCHDHKFEPLSQRDYYQLQAVFYPAFNVEQWLKPNERFVHAALPGEQAQWEQHNAELNAETTALWRESATVAREKLSAVAGAFQNGSRRGIQAIGAAYRGLGARTSEHQAALKAIQQRRVDKPGKIACVVENSAAPPPVFLLVRGNHATPGEKVEPAPLPALADAGLNYAISENAPTTGRRLAWARWLTQPGSRAAALLARVQVNRIWQQHFGAGLVVTAENLGVSGSPPSHPELLEYLAGQFVLRGWSVKALHRLMMSSATYRQSSGWRGDAFEIDPENRLLWRMALRRLDAEALRDAMLATSGRLDPRVAGPYVPTARTPQGEVVVDPATPGRDRRSLYLQQRRTQTLSLLGVFDSPTIVFNCVQRPVSTIPLQSLSLLNSEFVIEQAQSFANRLAAEAGADGAARTERAFLLVAARPPSSDEKRSAREFIETQRREYAQRPDGEHQAWVDFCHMLLASSAFLYVE